MTECFFAGWPDAGPCDGRLIRGHLIPQQTIRRQVGPEHLWDDRTWVPMCGGPMGLGGHHGALDHAKTIRIPRDRLPPALEEFAHEHGLTWFLEREYGARGDTRSLNEDEAAGRASP